MAREAKSPHNTHSDLRERLLYIYDYMFTLPRFTFRSKPYSMFEMLRCDERFESGRRTRADIHHL